jgi:hypothetical protein
MRAIRNKYRRWYKDLMARANLRGKIEGEKHHAIPKSLGGLNTVLNIVYLTHREHFLAHWLLIKFTEGPERRKMLFALHCMRRANKNHQRIVTGWRYEIVRKHNQKAITNCWDDPIYRAKQTASQKAAWARPGHKDKITLQRRTPAHRKKLSEALIKSHSRPATKALLSLRATEQRKRERERKCAEL